MRFDRDVFFEKYRLLFGTPQHQYQVDGINRLLTGFETYYGWWDDIRQIANAFAQVRWETAGSFTPVVEAYYLGDSKKPNYFGGNTPRVLATQKTFWYWPHIGRGDIQLTHLDNYKDQTVYVRKYFPERVADFEARTGKPFDLVKYPEQALDGWISFCIFTVGMHLGTFRPGHNLDRYITPTRTDYFRARDIVNGDKNYVKNGKKIGDQIAEASVRFEKCLKASLIVEDVDLEQLLPEPASTADHGDPAGSLEDLPQFPTSNTVELPEPEAVPGTDGAALGDGDGAGAIAEPIGDSPEAKPSFFMSIEDWKPWAKRWLGRIWGSMTTLSLPAGGLGFAALQDSSNWYVYAAIGGVLIVLAVGLAIFVSLIILGIYLYQNRGIPALKELQLRTLADPNMKNVGLQFEKK